MNRFLENLEVWLSIAGVAVTFLVPTLFFGEGRVYWEVAAVTAVGVGVLHGGIFWAVRRRQRKLRRAAIDEIRRMMSDRINNKLAVMVGNLEMNAASAAERANWEDALAASKDIATLLRTLSEESLSDWRAHYGAAVARG